MVLSISWDLKAMKLASLLYEYMACLLYEYMASLLYE